MSSRVYNNHVNPAVAHDLISQRNYKQIPVDLSTADLSLPPDGSTSSHSTWSLWANFTALPVPDPRPWSLEEPNLHFLAILLFDSRGTILDCAIQRFGLRIFGTAPSNATLEGVEGGEGFTLNGRFLKLKGVNRHDMDPSGTGPAIKGISVLDNDVKLLKMSGVNFVRTAHYPQDQRFLELCDEYGLLVWEESIGWQNGEKDFGNELFMDQILDSTKRMISASINHPSVVIWGFLNEANGSVNASKPVYEKIVTFIREQYAGDTSRKVSWASSYAV